MVTGNILVGQSGGPTAVINASLAGVITAARGAGFGVQNRILGMRFAVEGFMKEQMLDLGGISAAEVNRLAHTPGSALGSCRYKLQDEDLPRIHSVLKKYNIRYLLYIGGNDTMDTIHRISSYCMEQGYELQGIGIPKTVDNDLHATDHTPGYASAARYVALSVQQAGRLACDMQMVDTFVVHQTVGREAGWLAAASALVKQSPRDAPHLIYLPEQPITPEQVLADVQKTIKEIGWAYIVVGEGTMWKDGTPVSQAASTDNFSNVEFGAMSGSSAALQLHGLITRETGHRGEFQIPESMPMAAADRVVSLDRQEAFACGVEAVHRAMHSEGNVMITINRLSAEHYTVEYGTVPLQEVAVRAKPMPANMITSGFVTDAFLQYAAPLVGSFDEYARLDVLPFITV